MKIILIIAAIAFASGMAQECVENASVQNGKCKCNRPYVGSGDLCCYHPAVSKACILQGDPAVRSFHNQLVGMDFPCGTHLASANSPSSCNINVYVGNEAVEDGMMYVKKVMILLRPKSSVSGMSYQMTFLPGGIYKISINNAAPVTHFVPTTKTGSYEQNFNTFIEVWKNPVLGTIHVHACDSEVTIRFPVGISARQARTTGVCTKSLRSASVGPQSMTLCGTSSSFISLNSYLSVATNPLNQYIYGSAILMAVTSPRHIAHCNKYQSTMKTHCKGSSRNGSLRKCVFILYQPVVRRCLYAASSPILPYSHRIFNVFQMCLDTYCQGTKSLCSQLQADERIKKCAPSLLECDKWPVYRVKNSQIVGEGGGSGNVAGSDGANNQGNNNDLSKWQPNILGGESSKTNTGTGGGVNTNFDLSIL